MKKLIASALLMLPLVAGAFGAQYYAVIANVNDEKLVLVDRWGSKFIVSAKIYCWESQFPRGAVILSTNDLSICVQSTLVNTATGNTCEVWCP